MDSEESSEDETFMRLLDEFRGKDHPYSVLREEMGKTLKSQGKKGKVKVKNAPNLFFKGINKRIHELRLTCRALPFTLKTAASISRIPILSRPNFNKRNERRQKSYDVWSFAEHLKRNVTSEERFDELCSLFKSRERNKVPRSKVEGTRSPKLISEKPSAEIACLQRKVKPKVISNQKVEDISKTNKILKGIREQKELSFKTDLNNFSKTSVLEINNNENISKPRETSYSKLNSTNSGSAKSSIDEFTILGTETSLKTNQFRPLKNSTLILSSKVDRSAVENMNLETDEINASRNSSENTQMENESVDNISFVTLRKKSRPVKNSSLFLSKEDDRIEINNREQDSELNGTSYSKSNSNNTGSEKSSMDEFTILETETSLKTHQFHPLKSSNLTLSSEIDRSTVENMNLETDEINASRNSSENTQMENESVDNISFVTLRKKSGPLKNSSLLLLKEDDRIEINNREQESELNGSSYSNLKIDDNNASKILSGKTKIQVVKSSLRTEFFESDFEKTQQGNEYEKFSPILSRGKIKVSSKKRKMPLEEKAALFEVEISDSEKTTEKLDIWNLKQQYGKAYIENIVKRAKRNPAEPVSDSERTTELLEAHLNQFRPLMKSSLFLSKEDDRIKINIREQDSELNGTSDSKSNSTNSGSKKSSMDEFTILGTEISLKTDQFRPLKNSTLILLRQVDRSAVENMNLETDEINASRNSSENTQIENESVDNISFVTLRKKSGPLKNSSLLLLKEDDRIEINNREQESDLNGSSYSNLKIDDNNASKILSGKNKIQVVKSSLRTEFFESGFEKTQQGNEYEKFSPILSRGKIKASSKKRKMPLEEKAALFEVEISDSEKMTEKLDIWNLKQQYGKAYIENIVKRAKRNPAEPVSDSERTTELLEAHLNQFRPLMKSSLFLSKEDDKIKINIREQDSELNGSSYSNLKIDYSIEFYQKKLRKMESFDSMEIGNVKKLRKYREES